MSVPDVKVLAIHESIRVEIALAPTGYDRQQRMHLACPGDLSASHYNNRAN
jgi:hypothetical protein